MLSNEDRLSIPFQFVQDFRGLALQCGDVFGSHMSNEKVVLSKVQKVTAHVVESAISVY